MSSLSLSNSSLINQQQVLKIAKLARLFDGLSTQQAISYERDLESVLTYFSELKQVDTSSVKATDIFRKTTIADLDLDIPNQDLEFYYRIRQNIINNFPNKRGDLLLLPIQVVE